MLRFLGTTLLLASVFGLGYYAGQRPVGELKQTVMTLSKKAAELSRNAVESTINLERNLRWHAGLVDAKERLVEAKSELLDRNLGNAAKKLAEMEEYLGKATRAGEGAERTERLKRLQEQVRTAREELDAGHALAKIKLVEIQKELDALIGH
jgi:uncharacterized protein (DUF342 family)